MHVSHHHTPYIFISLALWIKNEHFWGHKSKTLVCLTAHCSLHHLRLRLEYHHPPLWPSGMDRAQRLTSSPQRLTSWGWVFWFCGGWARSAVGGKVQHHGLPRNTMVPPSISSHPFPPNMPFPSSTLSTWAYLPGIKEFLDITTCPWSHCSSLMYESLGIYEF